MPLMSVRSDHKEIVSTDLKCVVPDVLSTIYTLMNHTADKEQNLGFNRCKRPIIIIVSYINAISSYCKRSCMD